MTLTNSNQVPANAVIAADALEDIGQHAREAYPDECCGALIAREGHIVRAVRLPNTTSAGARRRFRIGPSDYRFAEEQAREMNGTLAGFYHSHPDAPARPSQHDLEHAWPNLIYTITAVNGGAPVETTAWRLRDDRSGFDQQEL